MVQWVARLARYPEVVISNPTKGSWPRVHKAVHVQDQDQAGVSK